MIHRQHAQALVWFTLLTPLLLAMAGLAIDGAILLAGYADLQSAADGAARAGATQLDLGRLRATGGEQIALDPSVARATALAYLESTLARTPGLARQPTASIEVAQRRVIVSLQAQQRTAFLRIVHIDSVSVEATASADLRFGIRDADGR